MFASKTVMACLLASALWLPASAQATPPGPSPDAIADAIKKCPGLQNLDPAAAARIIATCPGLSGMLDPAMLQAARLNCPALNGNIDAATLAEAAQKCPALNESLPADKRKCPALANPGAPDPARCPAFSGAKPAKPQANSARMSPAERKLAKKADARMQSVVKNLERNKRSADALIQAAREAGADPKLVADLEKMSQAFRQAFMSTVSPEQIVESIFATPRQPETAQGLVIVGPDGSRWLVTPSQQPATQPTTPKKPDMKRPIPQPQAQQGLPPFGHRYQARPGQNVQPPVPAPGMTPPPGMMPPPGVIQPKGMTPPPGMAAPQANQPKAAAPNTSQGSTAQQPDEVIIMEETLTPMPMWPTKEQLGKDGVLKYLQKRGAMMESTI